MTRTSRGLSATAELLVLLAADVGLYAATKQCKLLLFTEQLAQSLV